MTKAQFKNDLGGLLRKHKANEALIRRLARGGGFMDKMFDILSTGAKIATKGIEIYNQNKDAIDGTLKKGKTLFEKLMAKNKKKNPVSEKMESNEDKNGMEQVDENGAGLFQFTMPKQMLKPMKIVMDKGGKISGGKLSGGMLSGAGLRKGQKLPHMSNWINQVKSYQNQHPNMSYKQAMIALSKRK